MREVSSSRPAAAMPRFDAWLMRAWDMLLIGMFGLLLLLLIYMDTELLPGLVGPLRLVLGLAFVLYAPGYALQAALFPHADDLDGAARFALSTGLSVAVLPPLVLVLDRLPWGLRTWPVILSIYLLFLICAVTAVVRRVRLGVQVGVESGSRGKVRSWWAAQDASSRRLYLVSGIVLAAALLSALAIIILPKSDEYYTEFYMLGAQGKAEEYPREAVAGQPLSIQVGVRNLEAVDMTYRIEIRSRDQVVGQTGAFSLAAGAKVEGPMPFTLSEVGDDIPVQIMLYKDQQEQPYRTLRLLLKVTSAP